MRPVSHSIVVTCILTPIWPTTAECDPASLWNHNGSVMALDVVGADHVIRYQEPRIGMRHEGVVSGTMRFKGTRSGNTYSGTAFVFSRRCGAHPFRATGTVSKDEREIVIYGSAPAGFDAACRPVVYRKDGTQFSFLRFVDPPPPGVREINRDQSAAEAAAERAHLEEARAAKEREELRNSQEQQERQAMHLLEQQERADRARREREERRLAEMRDFSNERDRCRKYDATACDIALNSPRASQQDVAELRNWRVVAEKLGADLDSCRNGSVAACDAALASPAVGVEQRPQLNEWRIAALPFNRAMAQLSKHARMLATVTGDAVGGIRDLQILNRVTGGLAAVLALALAAMALRKRHPLASGRPRPPAPSASPIASSKINEARLAVRRLQYLRGNLSRSLAGIARPTRPAARGTPAAIEALELAYAYVGEVREADTPTQEEHEAHRHHLDRLTLASRQLDAARKLDPDAILDGLDEKGVVYRFSINELEAETLLIEGITLHTYDNKRAVRALRKATTLNTKSSYPFYVLGVMQAANMNKGQALKALRRAVALKPQDLSYRQELNRVQSLSVGRVAFYKAVHACERIFDAVVEVRVLLAHARNNIRLSRRVSGAPVADAAGSLFRGAKASRYNRGAFEKANPSR